MSNTHTENNISFSDPNFDILYNSRTNNLDKISYVNHNLGYSFQGYLVDFENEIVKCTMTLDDTENMNEGLEDHEIDEDMYWSLVIDIMIPFDDLQLTGIGLMPDIINQVDFMEYWKYHGTAETFRDDELEFSEYYL